MKKVTLLSRQSIQKFSDNDFEFRKSMLHNVHNPLMIANKSTKQH